MKCPYCNRGGGEVAEPCKGCGYVPDQNDQPPLPYMNFTPNYPPMSYMTASSCMAYPEPPGRWYGGPAS